MSVLWGEGVTISIEVIYRPQEVSAEEVAATLFPLYLEDFMPSGRSPFTSRKSWQLH